MVWVEEVKGVLHMEFLHEAVETFCVAFGFVGVSEEDDVEVLINPLFELVE
jgi:hypothetical protein